ncbi:MAG: type I restriction enzyme HsdR N-terminal domain-containing protein [Flavobacteriaceae bacterium]|nr:type I restriction enzyme HsdR N-terminal domain-containing protein [Flavobacteriaceae bacterium]
MTNFNIKNTKNGTYLFDIIRKKYVLLTPEEKVRQLTIHQLLEAGIPKTLIQVEKSFKVNDLLKRYDIVVFKPTGEIWLLVECKAPQVNISQESFDQAARYNLSLKAEYLMLTNTKQQYYCALDYNLKKYVFLRALPAFKF